MTESASPYISRPRVTVLPVQPAKPGHRPFRVVEIDGEVVGVATSMTEVVKAARDAGIELDDLDDPDQVRWVGGGQYTWEVR